MFCGLLRWGVVLHEFKLQSRRQARGFSLSAACRVPRADVLRFAPLGCCSLNREVAVPLPSRGFRLPVACRVPRAGVLQCAPLWCCSLNREVAVPPPSSRFQFVGGLSGPEGRRSAICSIGVLCFTTRSCGLVAKLAFPFVGRLSGPEGRRSAICSAGVSFTTTSSRVPGGVG